MNKKSYKRNQNRLYREIKRRIIAEKRLLKPVRFARCEQKIETLKIRSIIPEYIEDTKEFIEYAKFDMARQITQKLISDGYLKFNYYGDYIPIAEDEETMDVKEIEAVLNVVQPWN
jgi:hypothetical protein